LERNIEIEREWNYGTGCTGEVVDYFNAGEAVSFKKASFINTPEKPLRVNDNDHGSLILSNPVDYVIPA
jgi:hypothetical protein